MYPTAAAAAAAGAGIMPLVAGVYTWSVYDLSTQAS